MSYQGITVSEADYLFHQIMHGDISARDGIVKCKDPVEREKLIEMLRVSNND